MFYFGLFTSQLPYVALILACVVYFGAGKFHEFRMETRNNPIPQTTEEHISLQKINTEASVVYTEYADSNNAFVYTCEDDYTPVGKKTLLTSQFVRSSNANYILSNFSRPPPAAV